MKSVLSFSGVVKRFGAQRVLGGIDLEVAPGEFFALVGVNGAGKTTLIKGLLDFIAIDEGGISIFDLSHLDPQARQRLAFLPERFVPPYYLTGWEHLEFTARLHGVAHRRDRCESLLTALDLAPEAVEKPVRELSKGMAQKLGLAGCLLSGRDLLLLDEPMSGLDPKARALFKRHLLGLHGKGFTLFFTTHLLADVEELCDRMGILHNGTLHFIGTPLECCRTFGADSLEQAFLNCIGGRESLSA